MQWYNSVTFWDALRHCAELVQKAPLPLCHLFFCALSLWFSQTLLLFRCNPHCLFMQTQRQLVCPSPSICTLLWGSCIIETTLTSSVNSVCFLTPPLFQTGANPHFSPPHKQLHLMKHLSALSDAFSSQALKLTFTQHNNWSCPINLFSWLLCLRHFLERL